MNLEKGRFYEYVVRDDHLIAQLAAHKDELQFAVKRKKKHKELREALAQTLALELETLDDATNQLELLSALEQERTLYCLQTRFLLMADYIDHLETVDEVFFPEQV